MSDLIKREVAIEVVDVYFALSEASQTIQNMKSLQDILKSLPSAEPEYKAEAEYWHRMANDYEDKLIKLANKVGNQPEVIRCKECQHWDKFPSCSAFPEYHECHALGNHIVTTGDAYCSRAERREDD